MKRTIILVSYLIGACAFGAQFGNSSLDKIFKEELSVAFIQDYKGRDISVKVKLYDITLKNKKIWFRGTSHNHLIDYRLGEKEGSQYRNIKVGDTVMLNGKIETIFSYAYQGENHKALIINGDKITK